MQPLCSPDLNSPDLPAMIIIIIIIIIIDLYFLFYYLRCRLITVSAKGGDPSFQHRDRLPAEAFGRSSPEVGQFRGGSEFSPLGGCAAGPAPGEGVWLARLGGFG